MPRLPSLLLALCLPALVAGCQITPQGAGTGPADAVTPNAVAGDAIEVTALDATPPATDAPADQATDPAGVEATAAAPAQPNPAPTVATETPAPQPDLEAEVPTTPKPAQQLACEKRGGKWTRVGKGALFACIQPTRDAGKQCSRESQCESQCLARSGTCAPFKPLLGCNEVLQDNGARVTLCID